MSELQGYPLRLETGSLKRKMVGAWKNSGNGARNILPRYIIMMMTA